MCVHVCVGVSTRVCAVHARVLGRSYYEETFGLKSYVQMPGSGMGLGTCLSFGLSFMVFLGLSVHIFCFLLFSFSLTTI